jgi:hypothetical protein
MANPEVFLPWLTHDIFLVGNNMQIDNDLIITGSTATWDMPLTTGQVLGSYSGRFVFKCYLSPVEILASSRLYRELMGPNAALAPEHEGHIAYALAQLKYCIVSAPPFWASHLSENGIPGNIPDLNILLLVLDVAVQAQLKYKENMVKERGQVLKSTIAKAEEMLVEQAGEEE